MNKIKFIQILQWLIIILLAICCFWHSFKANHENLISDVNFKKNESQYVNVSSDKTIKELKKINKELYDSINKLSNVKEAIQIKYITKYNTDTVKIDNSYVGKDSIYHYTETSDTINYDLDISATDVKWFKLGFSIQDSLMIVTRSNNGQNETTISNGKNTVIKDVTVFVPKKTWAEKLKEKTYIGIGVGVGYGVINKKPDIYIGLNAGIKF